MKDFIYRTALVKDNDDPDKKGRIKAQILPEFIGIEDKEKLRWIYPMHTEGGGGLNSSHNVPEIGEYVTVIIRDKFWNFQEYITEDYTIDNYPYTDFENMKSTIAELGDQTYPQPNKLQKFKDGSIVFRNTITGEFGLYHNKGTYVFFDVDGNVFLTDANTNKISINADGILIEDMNGNTIEMNSTQVNINNGNLTVDQ